MAKEFFLKNGNIVLTAETDGGVYSASQLKKIAELCDSESIMVKATEDQRLALIVKPEQFHPVSTELRSLGMDVRNYQDGLHQPISCLGALCPDHEQDALGAAMDISSELAGMAVTRPVKIGVNGCGKCCTPCHTLDVSIIGESSGYRISLGGKNSQYPEFASYIAEGVPADHLPRALKKVLSILEAEAQPEESLQEFIERQGTSVFSAALAEWSQDAGLVDFVQGVASEPLNPPHDDKIENKESDVDSLAPDHHPTDHDLDEIPVPSRDSSPALDVPISTVIQPTPEIRIVEVELADDANVREESHNQHDIEAEMEAEFSANMTELSEASEDYQSSVERDQATESLASAKINLEDAPPSVDKGSDEHDVESDEKLQHHLLEISERLNEVETDLRRESNAINVDSHLKKWTPVGFDIDISGNPVICWSNGIKTVISRESQKSTTLQIGDRTLYVTTRNGEIQLEIDGLKMILPSAA